MGREIWIYKLRNEKAKKGVRKLLNNAAGFSYTFKTFMIGRHNEAVFHAMDHNLKEITPELLFEITYWLSEEIGLSDEKIDNLLTDEMGISLLFESSTKSEANGFMNACHNYLDSIQEDQVSHTIFESGIIISSMAFVNFLDYFILFWKPLLKFS